MFNFLIKPTVRYSRLDLNGDRATSHPTLSAIFRYALATLLIVGISFWAGRISARDYQSNALRLDAISQVFRYNRTFGEPPSDKTDRAWQELFPEQGGFFKHPTIAPQRSAFSVFHQLHCLDGIRQGYWISYQSAREGRTLVEEEIPMMSSPPHIRHCIDLLRHALMCQPDTTIEIKDEKIGGVKGFGTEHQCRDWDQLVRWTSNWEDYEPESMSLTNDS